MFSTRERIYGIPYGNGWFARWKAWCEFCMLFLKRNSSIIKWHRGIYSICNNGSAPYCAVLCCVRCCSVPCLFLHSKDWHIHHFPFHLNLSKWMIEYTGENAKFRFCLNQVHNLLAAHQNDEPAFISPMWYMSWALFLIC